MLNPFLNNHASVCYLEYSSSRKHYKKYQTYQDFWLLRKHRSNQLITPYDGVQTFSMEVIWRSKRRQVSETVMPVTSKCAEIHVDASRNTWKMCADNQRDFDQVNLIFFSYNGRQIPYKEDMCLTTDNIWLWIKPIGCS